MENVTRIEKLQSVIDTAYKNKKPVFTSGAPIDEETIEFFKNCIPEVVLEKISSQFDVSDYGQSEVRAEDAEGPLYILIGPGPIGRTVVFSDSILVDLDEKDLIIGIEVFHIDADPQVAENFESHSVDLKEEWGVEYIGPSGHKVEYWGYGSNPSERLDEFGMMPIGGDDEFVVTAIGKRKVTDTEWIEVRTTSSEENYHE